MQDLYKSQQKCNNYSWDGKPGINTEFSWEACFILASSTTEIFARGGCKYGNLVQLFKDRVCRCVSV